MTPRIISRAEAGLTPVDLPAIRLPAPYLFLHHTVTAQYLADVRAGARAIQQIAFGRGYKDISYNFLVFADGQIVEGRGWGKDGAHTVGYNQTAHAFSLVGEYHPDPGRGFPGHAITSAQIEAVRWLTAEGKWRGYISQSATIRPHREVFATACPGQYAVNLLPQFRSTAPLPQENDLLPDEREALMHIKKAVTDGAQPLFGNLVNEIVGQIKKAYPTGTSLDNAAIAAAVAAELSKRLSA